MRQSKVKESVRQVLRFPWAMCVLVAFLAAPEMALAVPEVAGARVTDVTTSSLSLVWMTDIYGVPGIDVYSDINMTNKITDLFNVTPMPAGSKSVEEAAKTKRIMKVRVSGLSAATKYYVRAVMRNPEDPFSVGYSRLFEVVTASRVAPYVISQDGVKDFSNNSIQFKVYLPPMGDTIGLGDLIIVESEGSQYPLSAFAGDGINAPWGILDLNNYFSDNGTSLDLSGDERLIISVYRGGMLSTLTHYRRVPQDAGLGYVEEPVEGFFADINLDGSIDNVDFGKFKEQYRTLPKVAYYNPDFDFVEDEEGIVDSREFSKFSREYGRTGVE